MAPTMISNRIRVIPTPLRRGCSILDAGCWIKRKVIGRYCEMLLYRQSYRLQCSTAGADPPASTEGETRPGDEIADAQPLIAVDRHACRLVSSRCRRGRAFPG